MKKKLFGFSTKTLVGTALGAALFTVLFMFVKIPTGIPETQIQSAYGIGGFFAAMFGPIAGFLVAFIGHALSDIIQYGSAWWSWVAASGVAGLIMGLAYSKLRVEEGILTGKDILVYNIWQVIGNAFAWIVVAPVLDIVVYAEPVELVFTQGIVAAISNAVSAGVIGTILLVLYSKTRAKKGSLTKE
jgi:energy-coupling factor transport system substrate-specific component